MKPSKYYSPEQYNYGKNKEAELLGRIGGDLKETVTPTVNQFDTKDYTSDNYNIELKSRRFFDSNKYPNWLIPTNKFLQNNDKKLVVYYHWEKDDTLWKYCYNPDDVKNFIFGEGPISTQDHYSIPKRFFTLIV
jgi:hypothetical protein